MTAWWGRLGAGRSLQLRFMWTVALGATLFALLGGGAAYHFGQQRAFANSMNTIDGLVSAVEKSFAVGAFANDAVLLRELADGLLRSELVRSVEVRASDGRVLVRVHRGSEADTAGGAADADTLIERPLASSFARSEIVATLRLRADGGQIARRAAREAAMFGGLMVMQVAVVALLLYATAAWLVSGPIIRLARTLPTLAPGTDERLSKPGVHRDDEIGLLVDATNQLLDAHGSALARERSLRAEIEVMEAQYRQLFDSSSAGIFVLDEQGRLINSNPTVSRVVGMSLEDLQALRYENFVSRVFGRPEKVLQMMREAADRGQTVSDDLELRDADGRRVRWVHCLISVQAARRPDAPFAQTIEGVIYDVTERRSAERTARHRAEHDALTGAKNRGAIESWLTHRMNSALHAGASLTLMHIDLDGFKAVNDRHGHSAGDQVLVACARRMAALVRADLDLVGRAGGDEFVVALHGVGPADPTVERTARALIESLCQPVRIDSGEEVSIGASIGIACAPHHAHTPAALLASADVALYEVKRSGKNTHAMAAAHLHGAAPSPAPLAPASTFVPTDF